ncbi:hypothetical protein BCR34DRAFT_596775 [Clohesyomyces aquaticus]|uniref:Uncharacterized protein n=1 Tax=Clohesyomyces aquaticus TaxID=1231657 RepID=A0A1Y2A519_9PLEO|nr:hypothetical protein BCR34DRAFT_596775 [Clohesyomyces aquaticus]
MEALAVVGLAFNVLGLPKVAGNIVSTAHEIGQSANGLTNETQQFQRLANLVRPNVDQIIKTGDKNEELERPAKSLQDQVDRYWKAAFKTWNQRGHLETSYKT